jgi:hypothetical protein
MRAALLLAAICRLSLSQLGEQLLYVYASGGDNQWTSDWPLAVYQKD